MKKYFHFWLLAALVCGLSLGVTSCKDDDNELSPEEQEKQAQEQAVPVQPGVEDEADADREEEQKHHHAEVPDRAGSVNAVKISGILFHVSAPPQDNQAVIGIAPAMPAIRLIGSA